MQSPRFERMEAWKRHAGGFLPTTYKTKEREVARKVLKFCTVPFETGADAAALVTAGIE